MKRGFIIGAAAAALLGVAGAGMLALAKQTPWYSDADAYFAAIAPLHLNSPESLDFDAMSKNFHAAQDRYATTNKWLYADIGYALVAGGLMIGLVTLVGARRFARTWTGFFGLAGLTLLASAALALGLAYGGVFHPMGRGQVPPWADTAAIPLFGIVSLITVLTPTLALFVLAPLLLRPAANERLLILSRPPHWPAALITLLYLPLLAACAFLITAAPTPGGWALSIAGALFGWLFLNARALAIGPKRNKA